MPSNREWHPNSKRQYKLFLIERKFQCNTTNVIKTKRVKTYS